MGSGKTSWKIVAVEAKEPKDFAAELEQHLNTLVADGWTVQSMMERVNTLVVVAQKIEPASMTGFEQLIAGGTPRRREVPAPKEGRNEVIYTFLEHNKQQQLVFTSLEEALDVVEKHLESDDFLPVDITTMSTVSYELADFPELRRAFPARTEP